MPAKRPALPPVQTEEPKPRIGLRGFWRKGPVVRMRQSTSPAVGDSTVVLRMNVPSGVPPGAPMIVVPVYVNIPSVLPGLSGSPRTSFSIESPCYRRALSRNQPVAPSTGTKNVNRKAQPRIVNFMLGHHEAIYVSGAMYRYCASVLNPSYMSASGADVAISPTMAHADYSRLREV